MDLVKQKGLPTKDKLYSLLNGKEISYKGYGHLLTVWNNSDMKTMIDYQDFSLKYDI